MNKFLRQNWKIFQKVRLVPIGVDEPTDIENINQWCERVWNHLINDKFTRYAHYVVKGKQGRVITVLSDDEYVYIVQTVRTEYNTDETKIMMAHATENNINDFKAIAKMIHYNIKVFIGHSIKAVREANILSAKGLKKEIHDA